MPPRRKPEDQISERINKKFEHIERIAQETRIELNEIQIENLKSDLRETILEIHETNPSNEFNTTTKEEIRSHLLKVYNTHLPILKTLHIEYFQNFLILFNLEDDIITFNMLPNSIQLFNKDIKLEFPLTYKVQNLSGFRQTLNYLRMNSHLLESELRNADNITLKPFQNGSNILITGQTETSTINLLCLAENPPQIVKINKLPNEADRARNQYLSKSRRTILNITDATTTQFEATSISGLNNQDFTQNNSETQLNKYEYKSININILSSYFTIQETNQTLSITHNNQVYTYTNTLYSNSNIKTVSYKSENNNTIVKSYKRTADNSYHLTRIEYLETIENEEFRTVEFFNENGVKIQTVKYVHYKSNIATLTTDDQLEWKPVQAIFFNENQTKAAIVSTNPEENHMISSTNQRIEHFSRMQISNNSISTPESYLQFLAENLVTTRDLDLFINSMMQYTSDTTRDDMQTAIETINSINENQTQMTGDCEDYANLIKNILNIQGKESIIIAIPGHSTTIWVEQINNKFIAHSAGTFGVESSPRFNSQEDAINHLFIKYGENGLGVSEGVNYATYKNFLHLPIRSSSENLMDIVTSTDISLENTNQMYQQFVVIIRNIQQNQTQQADEILDRQLTSLSEQEQKLYLINYCKVLINQKKFGQELNQRLAELESYNDSKIQTHISFLKASIYQHNQQWELLKQEIEILKLNTYYRLNNYYLFFYKILKKEPSLYTVEDCKQRYNECQTQEIKIAIAQTLIEKILNTNNYPTAINFFIEINQNNNNKMPNSFNSLRSIYPKLIVHNDKENLFKLTDFLAGQFNDFLSQNLIGINIPFDEIFRIIPDDQLLLILQKLHKIQLTDYFTYHNRGKEVFNNKPKCLKYLIQPLIHYEIILKTMQDNPSVESYSRFFSKNKDYLLTLFNLNPNAIDFYQEEINKTLQGKDETQSFIQITANKFYLIAIETVLENRISPTVDKDNIVNLPLVQYIKSNKQTISIENEEIETLLSNNDNFNSQTEIFKAAFREIVLKRF